MFKASPGGRRFFVFGGKGEGPLSVVFVPHFSNADSVVKVLENP